MELKQIAVYDFSELSDDAKEKVLNKLREQNEYTFLEDNLKEELTEKLQAKNIKETGETSLRYSLGYSQGDGLSFIGDFEFRGLSFCLEVGSNSNNYSHSHTINIIAEADDYEETGDITDEINTLKQMENDKTEEEFKEVFFKICDQLEKIGYSFIECEDSDENIKNNIEANDYKFLINGEIF
ncbi:hypothetical protein LCGC14_2368770 [marine sediment metagenome]|uniref:Uncharacterized protein n=1 Tax=marine sediment metagenome TaxID=412755 RepID=A0A0F9C4B1_9ZZZZ